LFHQKLACCWWHTVSSLSRALLQVADDHALDLNSLLPDPVSRHVLCVLLPGFVTRHVPLCARKHTNFLCINFIQQQKRHDSHQRIMRYFFGFGSVRMSACKLSWVFA